MEEQVLDRFVPLLTQLTREGKLKWKRVEPLTEHPELNAEEYALLIFEKCKNSSL